MEYRNIAIISHVDHGKTTLVDALLRQTLELGHGQEISERAMDSNVLERERGITILAKNTAVEYEGVKINIVDTPGHTDFGGEVERVLGMVDGCLLLVDAAEGPMPQTRFVLRKAIELGLKPIVVVNKVDRMDARPDEVVDLTFDLMADLGASDEQLDFPILYAVAREGKAFRSLDEPQDDMRELFETVLEEIPAPEVDLAAPFQMLVTNLDYSEYLGRIVVGRVRRGEVRRGEPVNLIHKDGTMTRTRVVQPFTHLGLERIEVEEVGAGDIVALSGIENAQIGETIADIDDPEALPIITVDEPTVSMMFGPSTSPFAGKEGKYVTIRHLRDRLEERDPDQRVVARRGATSGRVRGLGTRRVAPFDPAGDDAPRGLRGPGRRAEGHRARGRRQEVRALRAPRHRRSRAVRLDGYRDVCPAARASSSTWSRRARARG